MTRKERNKQYYEANKEAIKEHVKQQRLANPEQRKIYNQVNKNKINEYSKQQYLNNPEYYEQWRLNNKENIKQYYLDNKEKIKGNIKQRYESFKLPYYIVYLLPDDNYVGITNNPVDRMGSHRCQHKRNTSNWTELARFDIREEALKCEAEYHAKGYEGKKSA